MNTKKFEIGDYYICTIGSNPYNASGFMRCKYVGSNRFEDVFGRLHNISIFDQINKDRHTKVEFE